MNWPAERWFGVLSISVAATCSVHGAAASGETTAAVYVGKHFEVRSHDEPVKFVFNQDRLVARTTGSLSVTPRIQRFRLQSGWNLLSLAISVTNALYEITNSQSIHGPPLIYWLSPPTPTWIPLSPAQKLPAGAILWLKVTNEATLALAGSYAEPANRIISPDGGFLPSAGLEAWDLLPALSNSSLQAAWSYDSSAGRWLSWLAAPLGSDTSLPRVFGPGAALFVRAERAEMMEDTESAARIRYYHPDHIGSSSVITDASAKLMAETSYYPFGVTRNAFVPRPSREPYGFAQKERDQESGWHYLEARFLNSRLGRFLNVDAKYAKLEDLKDEELKSFLTNPEMLHLYTYVLGNPIKYKDPTGNDVAKADVRKSAPRGNASAPPDPMTLLINPGKESRKVVITSLSVPPGRPSSGGGVHPPNEVVITTLLDESYEEFYKSYTKGKALDARIMMRGPSDKGALLNLNLKNALVTHVSVSSGGEVKPTVTIVLSASEIQIDSRDSSETAVVKEASPQRKSPKQP